MKEYTKGKWEVGKTPPLSNWVVGVNLDDAMKLNVVAQLYNNKADANLIAAAPDTAEALRDLISFLVHNGLITNADLVPIINKGTKALLKAEGK